MESLQRLSSIHELVLHFVNLSTILKSDEKTQKIIRCDEGDNAGLLLDMSAFLQTASRFSCITFDWDGTLFDSTAIIVRCIQEAVREVGGTVPSDAQASYVIGLGLMQALAHAAPDVRPEKYPALGAAYKRQWALHVDDISFFPGTLAMLLDLKARGLKLAVATGKSRRGLDDVLARELEGVKLSTVFDGTRTADQTAGKPDPLMLHELMDELDVPAEQMLMIGDTTHDLLLARNAGVASAGVSFGAHAHDAFAPYSPLFVAHSMQELHSWLVQNV
jgi:phosphoglycolate phosphatase